jgi:hypothetical protein
MESAYKMVMKGTYKIIIERIIAAEFVTLSAIATSAEEAIRIAAERSKYNETNFEIAKEGLSIVAALKEKAYVCTSDDVKRMADTIFYKANRIYQEFRDAYQMALEDEEKTIVAYNMAIAKQTAFYQANRTYVIKLI